MLITNISFKTHVNSIRYKIFFYEKLSISFQRIQISVAAYGVLIEWLRLHLCGVLRVIYSKRK